MVGILRRWIGPRVHRLPPAICECAPAQLRPARQPFLVAFGSDAGSRGAQRVRQTEVAWRARASSPQPPAPGPVTPVLSPRPPPPRASRCPEGNACMRPLQSLAQHSRPSLDYPYRRIVIRTARPSRLKSQSELVLRFFREFLPDNLYAKWAASARAPARRNSSA